MKIDVAYARTNVKIIGVSGGISYGPLGMSHHSLHDIAVMRAFPGLTIILPCDIHQTRRMTQALVAHEGPAYVRMGRNAVARRTTTQAAVSQCNKRSINACLTSLSTTYSRPGSTEYR